MKTLKSTLLVLVKDNKILLSKKKRGFGMGILNGVGGKLEPNETPEQAMVREAKEEIGITLNNVEPVGEITFNEVVKGEREIVIMYLFLAHDFQGEIVESDEVGESKWYSVDDIPYNKMFKDDVHWLPLVLSGKHVKGKFLYDDEFNVIDAQVDEIKW